MKVAIFSCHNFERPYLENANSEKFDFVFIEEKLNANTVGKAEDCKAIALFSTDNADRETLSKLKEFGVQLITTRSAGTDHIDLEAAQDLGLTVANVPEYSPNAIAEHCIALTLALYRKLKPSFQQIANYNFDLDGLVGHEIQGKKVGICGTGDIGERVAKLFRGFDAKIFLFDAEKNENLSGEEWCSYVPKNEIFENCDIISLNLPLNEETEYFVSEAQLKRMSKDSILLNTGRGKLVDTEAVLKALKDNSISGFAMDVYEYEKGLFYNDCSDSKNKDKLLQKLIDNKKTVVTAHQAFLTDKALSNMMDTTIKNIDQFNSGSKLDNNLLQ